MAGYFNYSMSNNAIASYENGEKPLSKWTRSAILNAIAGMILNGDLPEDIVSEIDSMRTDELKAFLAPSSWHHTSCRYNRTQFFRVSDERILNQLGYVQCLLVTRSDGSSCHGMWTGERDSDTFRYTQFRTISGEIFPAADIVSVKIDYVKERK